MKRARTGSSSRSGDEAQRKARARALRRQIQRLISESAAPAPRGAPKRVESPLEFTERRMREIAAAAPAKKPVRRRAAPGKGAGKRTGAARKK